MPVAHEGQNSCCGQAAPRCFTHFLDEDNSSATTETTSSLSEETQDSRKRCDDVPALIENVRNSVIGDNDAFDGPYGVRKLTYTDYIASGRALSFIEDYISEEVLPMYGNTHTMTSATGLQTTLFRQEARDIISRCVHTSKDDVVLFAGSGATAAITLLTRVLAASAGEHKILVITGPFEHHSNLLPWRELGADIITVPETTDGTMDLVELRRLLSANKHRPFKVGTFSAASNVTGVLTDTDAVTAIMHEFGALSCWDYAAAAPYVPIDMNPGLCDEKAKDAIFISSHKFVGGVGAPGVLVVKKKLMRNVVPSTPGGGSVFFVDESQHRYLENFQEREEAGTPDIVGSIRAGLVFDLKDAIGAEFIERREHKLSERVLKAWRTCPNLEVLGSSTAKRLPIFSVMIRHANLYLHYNFVSALLNDLFGIQSRGGCACAGPYAQRLLGMDTKLARQYEQELLKRNELVRPGFCRIGIPFFSSETEIQFIIDAVVFVADHGWKFLPEYGYHIDSGEWRHRTLMTKMKDRRWLGKISYRKGAFSFQSQRRLATESTLSESGCSTFAELYLREAHRLREELESAPAVRMVDQELLLSSDAKRLRWFLLPSEAMRQRATCTDVSTHKSPFFVRRYALPEVEGVRSDHDGHLASSDTSGRVLVSNTQSSALCRNCFHMHTNDANKDATNVHACLTCDCVHYTPQRPKDKSALRRLQKKLRSSVGKAIYDFNMMQDGDRILVAVSGGKDSLTLVDILLEFKRISKVNFEVGACTVDPQTPEYDPSPLKTYFKAKNVPYFYESQAIIDSAKTCMIGKPSVCAFCARMKRGVLYKAARRENYNVLAMGQHLDDLCESFVMSAFFNGILRTMKANYFVEEGDLRVIRPLVYTRERLCRDYATFADLPVINENCPACFEEPKERQRAKLLLAAQEHVHPQIFQSMLRAMKPLMNKGNTLSKANDESRESESSVRTT